MAEEISKRTAVYSLPGMDAVPFHSDGPIDTYGDNRTGAVIIVPGYPDAGFERVFGRSFRAMGSTTSWARLIAASGMTAIAYSNSTVDLESVIRQTRDLGYERVALFASSGNAPLAMSALMRDANVRVDAAALAYPYTLGVPAEGKKFGFATPCDERSVADVANDIPLFIARAGRDEIPGLNATLDVFIAGALAANLPITVVNHASGPHAFDLFHDTNSTRVVIASILTFLRHQLLGTA